MKQTQQRAARAACRARPEKIRAEAIQLRGGKTVFQLLLPFEASQPEAGKCAVAHHAK
jgi:hypothetical protein